MPETASAWASAAAVGGLVSSDFSAWLQIVAPGPDNPVAMIVIRTVGKLLISVGVGVLLFVAWVLYGTGFYTAHQQNVLSDQYDSLPQLNSASGVGGPPKSFNQIGRAHV